MLEGEMVQFPISLLTAAALIDGIVEALMTYYDDDDVGNKTGYNKALETKATCAVAGVVDDVKDVLGVQKVSTSCHNMIIRLILTSLMKKDLNRCRAWIRKQVDSE